MITKNYKSIFSYLGVLTTALFVVSCDQEDNTGFSTLEPTSPTLSVTTSVSSKSLIEDDSVYEFTATLSTPQLVDVKLFISQVDGEATNGDDYTVDGSIVIPAGSTSAKGKITILSDNLIEATETVKIQIADSRTANAVFTPAFMEFTILNYTDGDLAIDLSWALASKTTDNSGVEIDPTDFADLRLLVSSGPNNTDIIGGADGGSFETFVMDASTPNGEYYIVADFYDANSDLVRDLDLSLELNQAGVINGDSYDFPAIINNANVCENNFAVLAKVTKSGDNYTFEYLGINNFENQIISWVGTDADYDSQVTTGVDCDGMLISNLNAGWMLDFWGEIVTKKGNVYYTVDGAGIVTIASQFLYTTTYNGAVQPDYYISGSGTYNAVTGELNIQYYLDQNGFSPSNWAFDNGYQSTPYFEATLTRE